MADCDIGLIGISVMGANLVLNIERNGFGVAVYNRTEARTREFVEGPAAGRRITAAATLQELVAALRPPRAVLIMVQAGPAVDAVLRQLSPLLERGDLIADCGNSLFTNTERRAAALEAQGLHFLGVGVSGGEQGALEGPSIMPGGPREAYDRVAPVLEAIAARVDEEPCVAYLGPGGTGHLVKMVHNGIEYGDMQLIAEAYDLMRRGLGLPAAEIADHFERWNQGPLSSYLIEITALVLRRRDEHSGEPLVDRVLDAAGQKGTGRWTVHAALDLGVPVPTISAAVDARALSALKTERERAASALPGPAAAKPDDAEALVAALGEALFAAKLCSYAQGFALLEVASRERRYGLDLGAVARIWRGGCIIRAGLLEDIRAALAEEPDLPNLLLAPAFREAMARHQESWRRVAAAGTTLGIPLPALSASLAYYDAYRSERLPANLIQAQRDHFGAHTYQRIDQQGTFHTDWDRNPRRHFPLDTLP